MPADFNPDTRLSWTAHPLIQDPPARTALLCALLLGISAGIALSFGGAGYGLLAFGLLFGSLSRYFLPVRYALDETGVTVSHLGARRQFPWTRFRRASACPDGVLLSPSEQPGRLDAFRTCFLRFRNNRDEVMRLVRTHVPNRPI